MLKMLWGRKIGMTQIFSSSNQVIPVTAVEILNCKILQRKTVDNDGYEAVQIGCLRKKYIDKAFSLDWLKDKKKYFILIKEISCAKDDNFEIGSDLVLDSSFGDYKKVSITGKTIGKGFQGCVKRHGFHGGRASHGDKLGRKPGSLAGLRTQGFVIKGKKLPGHDGNATKTIDNLQLVSFIKEDRIVFVKGAVPGKSGSFVKLVGKA